jgi:hypothetical protein
MISLGFGMEHQMSGNISNMLSLLRTFAGK